MVTAKKFTSRHHVLAVYLISVSWDSPAQTVYIVKSYLGQVDRVPRVGELPCLACNRFDSFSKKTYEKLALLV